MHASPRIPAGPPEKFDSSQELLGWMGEHLEQYGDIYKASVYGSTVYVISAPQYVEHVLLKNWQNYLRKGQAVKRIALSLGNGLISSNGEFWVKQRRMIQPAFSRAAVSSLAGVVLDANRTVHTRWKKAAARGEKVNVTRDVSALILEITLRSIFGLDYDKVAQPFAIVAEEARDLAFAQTCAALAKVIIEVAVQRRKERVLATDILGMVMQSRDRETDQPMSDSQLAKEILTIVIAGHETTASVLNWTWFLLSKHPQVEARMSKEIQDLLGDEFPSVDDFPTFRYTVQVIEEALRLYPPLWLMTRKAVKDDHLGEYFVPAGTEIYISPYLIQRHPAIWEVPDGFDPDRFAAGELDDQHRLAMCPFGAGPRNCIGEFFARIEMQIHLMMIAKDLRLRYDETRPPEKVAGMNLLSRHDFVMAPEMKTDV